ITVEPATLVLFGRDIPLIEKGGGNGGEDRRRRRKTGFEPVKKRPPLPPLPPAKPKVLVPPAALVRPAARRLLRDEAYPTHLVADDLLPAEPMAIMRQVFEAQDMSDVDRFLGQIEQDEQDAADVAELLALID